MPPVYDWFCPKCEIEFETTESIKEYTGKQKCSVCAGNADRIFKYCKFHFTGTKIEDAEFNVGLGKITKSKRHREELAKQMGVVEVGNENPDSLHKQFDQVREDKIKKSWEDA